MNFVNIGTTKARLLALGFAAAAVVAGCSAPGPTVVKDGYPDRDFDVSHIADAVPRVEPRTRAGNSNPYTVLGKTYRLVDDTTGFRERGYASWYGTKFHGLRTANGEIYDMYGMTAAHKTLPIPSYVRVTNQANGKSVVVRINDRGPFHGDRIIDLTYTAAKKLGYVDQGTALVEVEYLPMGDPQPAPRSNPSSPSTVAAQAPAAPAQQPSVVSAPAPASSNGYDIPQNTFLQVGAFGSESAARALYDQLAPLTTYPVLIKSVATDNLLRVQIGPFRDNLDLMTLRQKLVDANFAEPHVVYD